MADLTALDLYYASKELQQLVGAKIERIFQSEDKHDLLFIMYVSGKSKVYLRVLFPGMLCGMEHKPDVYPKVPPGFAMFLRKYVEGTRIVAVQQQGFDRVLLLDVAHKDTVLRLVIEFLAPGNMLLITEDKIKGLLENQNFKDRTLRGGIAYEPPSPAPDIPHLDDTKLKELISSSDKNSVVTTLALGLGLGGVYAEEVCVRANVDKRASAVAPEQLDAVVAALRELFSYELAPHTDGERIYPFSLASKTLQPCEKTSFLLALGTILPKSQTLQAKEREPKQRKSKFAAMLKEQESSIIRLGEQAHKEQLIAERIYAEYQLCSDILIAANAARTAKKDVAAALAHFPVKRYDKATADIEVELPDA